MRSLLIGFLTLSFDFVFHQTFTSPMEVPAYFAMKFAVSTLIAYFLQAKIGINKSALLFTIAVDVYYGLFVVVLGIPGLSSSPTQVIAIGGVTDEFLLLGLWTMFHGLFYWLAAQIVSRIKW